METKDSAVVQALFKNVYDPLRTVFAKPTAFDTDTSNHYVSRLNASTGINAKVGPSLVLKVMAGDQVQISTYAFYNSPVQQPAGGTNLLSDILSVLAGSVVNNSGGKLLAVDVPNVSSALNPNVFNFLSNGRSYDSTKPKAYLNWILFDNQFNYVSSNSGVQQVLPGSSRQVLSAPLQTMARNGYLYVYVSNESPQDVYFDQLTVKHYTGPLTQEQSYYPFGLQMAGISDKALLKQTTAYKYDGGVELEEDGGLNYYNTFYRKYDPQIGRFTGVDMLSEKAYGLSNYHYGSNSPAIFNDPLGALDEKPVISIDEEESPTFDGGHSGITSNGGSSGSGTFSDLGDFTGAYAVSSLSQSAWGVDKATDEVRLQGGNGLTGNYSIGYLGNSPGTRSGHNSTSDDPDVLDLVIVVRDNDPNGSIGYFKRLWYKKNGQRDQSGNNSANVLEGFGLEFELAKAALKYQAKNYSKNIITNVTSWASKASSLRAAKIASYAGKAFGVATVAVTIIETLNKGEFTLGDGVKAGIGLFTTFCPAGWIYGVADLGVGLITGESITDRVGDAIDGK